MKNSFFPIFTFSLAAFAIGLSEFIVIGVLGNIMSAFDVTLSEAGLLVSIYALGISIGAPIVTYLTHHINAKSLCIGLLALFSALGLATSLTTNFVVLLLLRAFSGIVHGTFFSVASASVSELVPKK